MKRQLETSSAPEQFESFKRLKVNPDLVSEEKNLLVNFKINRHSLILLLTTY